MNIVKIRTEEEIAQQIAGATSARFAVAAGVAGVAAFALSSPVFGGCALVVTTVFGLKAKGHHRNFWPAGNRARRLASASIL